MKELVDQITARLKDQGIEAPEAEISARLKMLIENFRVPEGEARRSVLNYFLKEHGLTPAARPASQKVKISEISEENRWVDLEVKVVQLWTPTSTAISQTGLIGDETGRIKFTKWARDNLPELLEGKSYLLRNVVTRSFQNRFSINLNRTSKIEEMTEEVQAQEPAARGPTVEAKIGEISGPGQWVDIRAKVVQLWEPASSSISQTGLIGDETGRVKFVKWARDSTLPELLEGHSYLFKNAVSDEFQGRLSIKLNRTSLIEELGEEVEASAGPLTAEDAHVADIQEPGRWINMRAKVVQIWAPTSDAVSQSGLLGDETGSMKFVKWAKSGLPDMAEGHSYLIKNAVTDEYQGRFSVKLNSTSQVEELSEDIAVGSQAALFSGALVDIQKGSGLIKRCPTCRRSLAKGLCADHGKVEGVYDLRIKAVLDDGDRVQDILMNREMTESLTGLTLDQAKAMAMEALDHEVVRSQIEEKLVGRYYTVSGPRIDRYILVESIQEPPAIVLNEVDDLIRLSEVA